MSDTAASDYNTFEFIVLYMVAYNVNDLGTTAVQNADEGGGQGAGSLRAAADPEYTVRKPARARAADYCRNMGLVSWSWLKFIGKTLFEDWRFLGGWCTVYQYGHWVISSMYGWGHRFYSWGPVCVTNKYVTHGPDGNWYGNHTDWAHGGTWGTAGLSYPWGCAGLRSRKAILRAASNYYWDTYDDFGF